MSHELDSVCCLQAVSKSSGCPEGATNCKSITITNLVVNIVCRLDAGTNKGGTFLLTCILLFEMQIARIIYDFELTIVEEGTVDFFRTHL